MHATANESRPFHSGIIGCHFKGWHLFFVVKKSARCIVHTLKITTESPIKLTFTQTLNKDGTRSNKYYSLHTKTLRDYMLILLILNSTSLVLVVKFTHYLNVYISSFTKDCLCHILAELREDEMKIFISHLQTTHFMKLVFSQQ